ncbi:MAG TPA: aldo/keto reductase [Azoarcus taiwanensis]|uniref:Aldo/keto reductase n=1 Tax=Azoarcus taiwanensis TaxID=666964 RepID=A0A972J8G6_9RHOO|nr:aldo/keto reductase [Azoarcus taiwanensis]NMG03549.1 aldo/keto reductase [Azoarcus taiwanensis]HRQ57216.1 aldo/keto reductase [Azoarcus taiwanensis]
MQTRKLGPFDVGAIGLGCMNLSHAYGVPPSPEEGGKLLLRALEMGVTHFDTAALYGFGANEKLVGEVLSPHRSRFTLASKCGMTGVDVKGDGKLVRVIDGRPATIKATCEASLRNLRTDVIDLYYLHRLDKQVPIEDSVGALADLVSEGKIRTIGLSEVSADTLRRAHAVHPVAALQTEYSPWTRNPEIAVLETCRELGVSFVAFSPLARGFLADALRDPTAVDAFADKDIRRGMPRFQHGHFEANLLLLDAFRQLAREAGCTPAQLAIVWVLAKGDDILPIPGTSRIEHLEENLGAADVRFDQALLQRIDDLINERTVSGPRYPEATQAEIDTEEFRPA